MAVVPPPVPEPREPEPSDGRGSGGRPLSRREKHSLADLEARATVEDPRFCARMGRDRPALLDEVSPQALNRSIQAVVVLMLAVLILPTVWLGVLFVVLVLVGPVVAAIWAIRRGHL